MGVKTKNASDGYTRIFESFRGVDFSRRIKASEGRLSYLENMYIDYEGGGGLESIPGFRKLINLNLKINGIFSQKHEGEEYLIVHGGDSLFRFNLKDRDSLTANYRILSGLANRKSDAVLISEVLYIFDGSEIALVNPNGSARFSSDEDAPIYVPTTHVNGEKHEPRNLLTPKFYQRFRLKDIEKNFYGTPGLYFTVTNYEERLCSVSGGITELSEELYIPTYTVIGGVSFRVSGIADYAFAGNTAITHLYTGCGLENIGNKAFFGCTALKTAVLSDTVKTIGFGCFENCELLSSFFIGREFEKFGDKCFQMCRSLQVLYYAGELADFLLIDNHTAYEDRTAECGIGYRAIKIRLPVMGDVETVERATIDSDFLSYDYLDGGLIVYHENRELLEGREIVVEGRFNRGSEGILAVQAGKNLSPEEIIYNCRVCSVFDGRIFLSANPAFAGTVFYSSADKNGIIRPLYFSAESYITDGDGGNRVVSMPVTDGALSVVLEGDGGSGSIFVHKAEGDVINRSFPIKYVHKGIASAGSAISFMGESLFVCSLGICALVKNSEKELTEIVCRSSKISSALLSENIGDVSLTEWRGYLVVSVGGRIYLADSRGRYSQNGDFAYEWYYLNGIGGYNDDPSVYRYSSVKKDGYLLSAFPDEKVEGTVYSAKAEDGSFNYYTLENSEKISVYRTEEHSGGVFYPATVTKAVGDLLFFGTDNGDIFLFNSDKRGAPPPYLSEKDDFDAEEYGRDMGTSIHPYYYSFGTHGAKYILITAFDDGDLPHLEKNSRKASTALKLKCVSNSEVSVAVKTDGNGFFEIAKIRGGRLDFSDFDFSKAALTADEFTTVTLDEKERGWIEKQYVIRSEGFRAPIGIESLSYSYKPKGKTKNR